MTLKQAYAALQGHEESKKQQINIDNQIWLSIERDETLLVDPEEFHNYYNSLQQPTN